MNERKKRRRHTYARGDVVWWWSKQSGEHNASKAVFVRYDEDFPDEDAILAMKIGEYRHAFRWPLRFIEPLD